MNGDRTDGCKNNNLASSFKYALEGIRSSFIVERNMKIHVLIMLLVIVAGFILKISALEWVICIILFGIVISCELINTAIEAIVDALIPYKSDKAKLVKDVAAGAVLVSATTAAVAGALIFIPKIILHF